MLKVSFNFWVFLGEQNPWGINSNITFSCTDALSVIWCVERAFIPFSVFQKREWAGSPGKWRKHFPAESILETFKEVFFQLGHFNNVTCKVGGITSWAVDIIRFYVTAQWLVLPTVLQLPWIMVLIFPGTGVGCRWQSYTLHYESQHPLLCLTVNRHRQMLTHLHTHRYKSGFFKTAPDITALALVLHPSEKLWIFFSCNILKPFFLGNVPGTKWFNHRT